MCEVLAISANRPVGVSFSWAGFEEEGTSNPDGWGYAYRTDGGLVRRRYARTLNRRDDATDLAGEVESPVFLAHVRQKVQGPRSEENSQPFFDPEDGVAGVLTVSAGCRVSTRYRDQVGDLREGNTGAELLFLLLVRGARDHGGLDPGLRQVVQEVFDPGELEDGARASFVLTDGRRLLAFRHSKPLWRVTREPPHDRDVRLRDPDLPEYKARLRLQKATQETATLFATVRLTQGEKWERLPERTLLAVEDGRTTWSEPLDGDGTGLG